MKGLNYRDYAIRIKERLMEEDPIKYKFVSKKAIQAHIKHIGWCLTQVVSTNNDNFDSPYFILQRGFKKYFHAGYQAALYKKKVEEEKRLLEQSKTG